MTEEWEFHVMENSYSFRSIPSFGASRYGWKHGSCDTVRHSES